MEALASHREPTLLTPVVAVVVEHLAPLPTETLVMEGTVVSTEAVAAVEERRTRAAQEEQGMAGMERWGASWW
jgi:hypothetical protein